MSQDYEGWGIDTRPAVKGLAIFGALLLALVFGAGTFYNDRYAAQTRADPHPFPAPQLETVDSAPSDRDKLSTPRPPAGIERAMAATAARGDALWNH